jgi:putative endonuclease
MPQNMKIGRLGEHFAGKFLEKHSYQILAKNYKEKFGEIDIIARSPDSTLVFVEVKALTAGSAIGFSPEDNLTTQKLKLVNRMAEYFVARYPNLINEEFGWRIDLLAIEIFEEDGSFSVRHYENI